MCKRKSWEYLSLKDDVLKKYRNKCANCGSKENLEIHHIVPLSLGGTNNITNLVPLCYSCHKAAHQGRHLSHYRKAYNNPQPRTPDEEAYKIFDDYFAGNIGRAELKEKMGFSKSYKITDCPQFKKYFEEKNIERYKNNIDTILSKHDKLNPGVHVGFVVYKDGTQEYMIYQKDKIVKEEPEKEEITEDPEKPKKPECAEDLYEAYLTGAMGFSETDYRMTRFDNIGWNDFRKSPRFQKYLEDHNIEEYQSNVDMIIRVRGNVAIGDEVGYVLYKDGSRELMIHH